MKKKTDKSVNGEISVSNEPLGHGCRHSALINSDKSSGIDRRTADKSDGGNLQETDQENRSRPAAPLSAQSVCCCGNRTNADKEKSGPRDNAPEIAGSCCRLPSPKSAGCCAEAPPVDDKKAKIKSAVILGISLLSLVAGYFDWHKIGVMFLYYVSPAWIAVVLCGLPIFKAAAAALSRKKITAAVLISTAIIASVALEFISMFGHASTGSHSHSYIFAAGEVAFLMAIGGIIEDLTVKKTRSGIKRLVGLIPKEAYVKTSGGLEKRALKDIEIGDIVVAKAGEMIAVDGIVVSGASAIDQSSVTGEYLPVDRAAGDYVYGGTFNQTGALEIRVEKRLNDMTVAKMAELVEEAEGKKAPIARLADRWASYIVPSAIVLSAAVGLLTAFAFGKDFNTSLVRAVTVLVVFCPCALALATPTAIAAGIGNAAKNGVLIKSGQALEALSKTDTVCFDKTGTLTTGEIKVSELIVEQGFDEERFIRLIASAESYSEHPLAKAVARYAQGTDYGAPSRVETVQGAGIEAETEGVSVKIYNVAYAKKQGYENEQLERFARDRMQEGKTVVIAIVDERAVGAMSFSDSIRESSPEVISGLQAKGYATVMLTGDNESSARYIADKCGITEINHSLLPADKQTLIAGMQESGKRVCMLGDGVNDAPSLKLADCGIAMGALGSDMALDTADMAILNGDMQKVSDTLTLSKRVLSTIKRNIFIAMGINFAAIAASAFGLLTPVTGAIVHNFTSILVVLSSAMLLRSKSKAKSRTEGA